MHKYETQGDLFTPDEDVRGESMAYQNMPWPIAEYAQHIIGAAEPVLKSKSFQRLHDVTFLGILSPRYADLPEHPLAGKRTRKPALGKDGSRADHSLAIAALVGKFCGNCSPDLGSRMRIS